MPAFKDCTAWVSIPEAARAASRRSAEVCASGVSVTASPEDTEGVAKGTAAGAAAEGLADPIRPDEPWFCDRELTGLVIDDLLYLWRASGILYL